MVAFPSKLIIVWGISIHLRKGHPIPPRRKRLEATMTREERLKREARETATRRGHRLGRFRASVITVDAPASSQRPAAVAACEICGALVVVDPAPPAGKEAITGEGVIHECGAIEQEGHETA
jgi:hypothetical protein